MKLENLTYSIYENGEEKQLLKNINLVFERGKITVITGPNGSGKSTLIKILMGILAPKSGKIFYDSKDITHLSISERARYGITMAFQQPVKFKGITVKDLIDVASQKNNGVNDACAYLSMVGLCARDYLSRPLDATLSGGELKRIELAIALAKGGEVFLFDEPEAGIDLWSFDDLVGIFKKLKGKTIIIVSHQQKILDIADNIVLLNSSSAPVIGSRKKMLPLIHQNKGCEKLGGGV